MILKRRKRLSREEWFQHVEKCLSSHMSRRRYCEVMGLHPKTFHRWYVEYNKTPAQAKQTPEATLAFVSAEVTPPTPPVRTTQDSAGVKLCFSSGVEVWLPRGARDVSLDKLYQALENVS